MVAALLSSLLGRRTFSTRTSDSFMGSAWMLSETPTIAFSRGEIRFLMRARISSS